MSLERATEGFRIGYGHGRSLQPYHNTGVEGTFRYIDYRKGFEAGLNDRFWSCSPQPSSRQDFINKHMPAK